jgi:hypothetical protein
MIDPMLGLPNYFSSFYFWTTTAIAIILGVSAVIWNNYDGKNQSRY